MCLAEWSYAYKHGLMPDEQYIRFYSLCLKQRFPWLSDVSSNGIQNTIRELVDAFKRYFNGTTRHPKFKKKSNGGSFTMPSVKRFKIIGRTLIIEKLRKSPIMMSEKVRFDGQCRKCTISTKANRWFVSVLVKMENNPYASKLPNENQVGVDFGIKQLATLSDGTFFPASQPLKSKLEKLAKLQRQLSKKDRGSNRYNELKARIAEVHYFVVCKRQAVLHELTDYLTKTYRKITIEDLSVKGMMKNSRLARAISDCGFSEFRRQLEYKSKFRGCNLVIADRWFPSSKMCSQCGVIKKNLTLADRIYKCECGLEIDRDKNASINLMNYVEKDTN